MKKGERSKSVAHPNVIEVETEFGCFRCVGHTSPKSVPRKFRVDLVTLVKGDLNTPSGRLKWSPIQRSVQKALEERLGVDVINPASHIFDLGG